MFYASHGLYISMENVLRIMRTYKCFQLYVASMLKQAWQRSKKEYNLYVKNKRSQLVLIKSYYYYYFLNK